jgi:hypothetical protein
VTGWVVRLGSEAHGGGRYMIYSVGHAPSDLSAKGEEMFKKMRAFFQVIAERMVIKDYQNSIRYWEKEVTVAEKRLTDACKVLNAYRNKLYHAKRWKI